MVKRSQCATDPDSWWSALNAANQDGPSDGRLARSERTKRKIVDAALRVVDGDSERFTTGAIARRAGVSVRTLFTHYPEIEVLLDEVSNIVSARFAELIRPIAPTLPLEQRIASFVDEQSRMFESMVGFHRALRLWRDRSPVIALRFACYQSAVREKLRGSFDPELNRLPPRQRHQYFELLAATSDWEYWDSLRQRGGMSVDDARHTLGLAMRTLLSGMLLGAPKAASAAAG